MHVRLCECYFLIPYTRSKFSVVPYSLNIHKT